MPIVMMSIIYILMPLCGMARNPILTSMRIRCYSIVMPTFRIFIIGTGMITVEAGLKVL
jgi:hypothetical protein